MAPDIGKRQEQNKKTSSDVEMTHAHGSSSERSPRRWQGSQMSSGPFGLMRQMQDEVDRWFGRLGVPGSPTSWLTNAASTMADWTPAVDAFQRGSEFIIRADVPGMQRSDLNVEVGDDTVTIRGERKHEVDEDRDGVFWSERSYGSFSRVVPLPAGAIGESAKASFTNGVLEIVISAPSQEARRGRKIDISGAREGGERRGA